MFLVEYPSLLEKYIVGKVFYMYLYAIFQRFMITTRYSTNVSKPLALPRLLRRYFVLIADRLIIKQNLITTTCTSMVVLLHASAPSSRKNICIRSIECKGWHFDMLSRYQISQGSVLLFRLVCIVASTGESELQEAAMKQKKQLSRGGSYDSHVVLYHELQDRVVSVSSFFPSHFH